MRFQQLQSLLVMLLDASNRNIEQIGYLRVLQSIEAGHTENFPCLLRQAVYDNIDFPLNFIVERLMVWVAEEICIIRCFLQGRTFHFSRVYIRDFLMFKEIQARVPDEREKVGLKSAFFDFISPGPYLNKGVLNNIFSDIIVLNKFSNEGFQSWRIRPEDKFKFLFSMKKIIFQSYVCFDFS